MIDTPLDDFFIDSESSHSFRDATSVESRAIEFEHRIDPGFVNRRLVNTIIGPKAVKFVNEAISKLPPLPEGLLEADIDHVYEEAVRYYCQHLNVPTLGAVLAAGKGRIFCSIEQFVPCPDVYDVEQAISVLVPAGNFQNPVVLEYSTRHIRSDTLRLHLHQGTWLATIAIFDRRDGETPIFRPLVIGWPWLSHPDEATAANAMFVRYEVNENFVDDFDEFSKVREVPAPDSCLPMRDISEAAFKQCLATILGDETRKDWGGETSDH